MAHSRSQMSLQTRRDIIRDIFTKCEGCSEIIAKTILAHNTDVCPHCQFHHKLSGARRLKSLIDPNSFEPYDADMTAIDLLDFTDLKPYKDRLKSAKKKTGQNEAVRTGKAFIKGRRLVLCCMDFDFVGGSMGRAVGEKITRAIEKAGDLNLPLVIVSCSGGARLQEGVFSLIQMAKVSATLARYDEQGGLLISVLTHPTTGGVFASFAMLGDVILAEPRAYIAFAGWRVIQDTIGKQSLPDKDPRNTEFFFKGGLIDRIVHRHTLRDEIARIIDYCGK